MKTAITVLALLCITAPGLRAQSSASFAIEADVFDAGGLGRAAPAGASFAAMSVLGQTTARNSSASAAFVVSSGIVCFSCGNASQVGVDTPTGASDFFLGAAYPNPAHAASGIGILVPYGLSAAARITLRLHDMFGRVAAILHDGEQIEGRHSAVLDASALPQGTYLLVLEAPGTVYTGTITVLR